MRCPACSLENREGARFCRACGAPLAITCSACGTEAAPASVFCDRCGTRLGEVTAGLPAGRLPATYTPRHLAERILSTRAALEGERKHVTVLFADVAGFTAMAERADPEEMHGIMDRCFDLILGAVHRYEGTVNQFTGDGVMALFGAPVALEDASRRAVLAALGIQRVLEPLRKELLAAHGFDFRMRIGINTGLVVVGRIGNDLRMEYTAIGDTINLAARLQTLAAPGTILVSEATHRLVTGSFETRDLGPMAVKGKSEPVGAFEIIAERPLRGRIDLLADVGLSPLVGRQREIEALGEAFASARQGRGQVVFLVGEAGIGKSRLLYEFRRRLGNRPHRWIEGRCASYGTATAFLPIIDGLRRYLGIDDRDDDTSALGKIDRGIAALGGDLGWTLPFVRHLLSLPAGDEAVVALDAATRRSETFRALKACTLQAARDQPLLVVIEDLHWIDPASEEYLAFLADVIPATASLLVCSHRPGYRHPFGDRSYHVRIALHPLSEAETTTMTAALLGTPDAPAALRDLVANKAEGNPLFVEELTKSLLEEGVLRQEDGRVQLVRDLADITVPDTIQDILMARIDRLPENPKHAIQVASVIGREFAVRLLERITELGDRVQPLVEELRALELIYEKAAHPELAYMFKHALTHDVAYESILVQRRKALHRLIGTTIEELYADRLAEHYETLALHFSRGEDWEKALDYHERAAAKALGAYANHAVIDHCRQALAIAERLGDRVAPSRHQHLEELLGMGCFYVSEFRASGDALTRAAACSVDAEARAVNLGRAAHSYLWGHAYDAAHKATDDALVLSRAEQLPAGEAMALLMQGFSAVIHRGDLAFDARMLEEARRLAERAGNDELTATVRFLRAEVAEWTGEYRHAIALCEEALSIARRLRLAHFVIWPKWFAGKAFCCLGEYGRAMGELQEAADLCERIGDRAWRTRLLNTLGWCLAEIGSHRRARAYNEQAAAIAHDIGDPEIVSNAEINLAGNSLALGDLDRAAAYLEPIRATLAQPGDPWMRWRYSLHVADALGRVALARREPERALVLAEEELAGARRHEAPKIAARGFELRGRALLVLDRREEAATSLDQALELAGQIGYPPTRWRALALLAELRRRTGERAEAEACAARARALIDSVAHALPEGELQREFAASAAAL